MKSTTYCFNSNKSKQITAPFVRKKKFRPITHETCYAGYS